ncbi:MAG TPA: hypothetical protein VGR49_00065 [Actinomycetota bacterium]|jgi:hypothetical protein|nr:hypothetical protein [Actinomycetota bacterium]
MARRSSVLVFLLGSLTLAACTSQSEEFQIPPEGTGEASTAGLETVAIRETILEFLDAYARSGDTVEPLRDLVTGPELRDWVHWLGVQNRHLEQATGNLEVRAVRILQIRDEVAAAAVDADVRFTFLAEEGEESAIPRSFQSPVILSRHGGPGSWAVLDVVRDGRSMTDSITVLKPPVSARDQGLVVEAVSVYRFTAGTVVNLRVRNVGGDPVRIDRERSVLQVAGQSLRPLGTTVTFSGALPPDRLIQGAFDFPNVELTTIPEGMLLRFHDGREPITLAFPAEAFAQGA